MDPIMDIAMEHNLKVIEDAAQAHGAEYKGHRVGSIGDLGCFSFYPGKNLGAYGEGGMVVTSNKQYAKKIRMLRDWGQEKKYYHVLKGFNYRLEGLQGAILRVKLRHLEAWTEARRLHAHKYTTLLHNSGIISPTERPNTRHVFHVYALRVKARDRILAALKAQNIVAGIHYPIPVHLQPAYGYGYNQGDFPVTEIIAAEELSLPIFSELTDDQRYEIVKQLHQLINVD
jgi:dTDP-4-amino-4,6-dideoxygalactose transaminase